MQTSTHYKIQRNIILRCLQFKLYKTSIHTIQNHVMLRHMTTYKSSWVATRKRLLYMKKLNYFWMNTCRFIGMLQIAHNSRGSCRLARMIFIDGCYRLVRMIFIDNNVIKKKIYNTKHFFSSKRRDQFYYCIKGFFFLFSFSIWSCLIIIIIIVLKR